MGSLQVEIKQRKFKSDFVKGIINVLYTGNYLRDIHANVFEKYGTTSPQFNVLRILRGQHPKPSTVNLLIDRMLDKSSNASRIVDILERKGLVTRKQSIADRRAADVLITNEGQAFLSDLSDDLDSVHNEINLMTKEESIMLNILLDKMRGN
jgi:DNA-binding MarR family transcriptional regulator